MEHMGKPRANDDRDIYAAVAESIYQRPKSLGPADALPPNPKQIFGDKKPPLDEFPLTALIEASLAHFDGDLKYGFRNWLDLPVEARTYIKGALRHLHLWANGEERARDGAHNLGHAIAGLAILIDAQANNALIDNRRKSQAACDRLHEAEADVEMFKAMANVRADLKAGLISAADAKQNIEALARGESASTSPPPAPVASTAGADTTAATSPAPSVAIHDTEPGEPIPDGVTYAPDHKTFYRFVDGRNESADSEGGRLTFYNEWYPRREEFPKTVWGD